MGNYPDTTCTSRARHAHPSARTGRALTRTIGGIVVPLALLVAAACSDDDNSELDFCDGARQVTHQLADIDLDDADGLADLADTIDRTMAPVEIADDWATLTTPYELLGTGDLGDPSVLEDLADLEIDEGETSDASNYDELAGMDLTDTSVLEGLADDDVLDGQTGGTATALGRAAGNVTDYLDRECGG